MKKKKSVQKPAKSRTHRWAALKKTTRDLSDRFPFLRRVSPHLNTIIFFICATVLLIGANTQEPQRRGDGSEYFQMMISLSNHGTPDLREGDINDYNQLRVIAAETSESFRLDIQGKVDQFMGYYPSVSGKNYSFHFWLYSLSAVPIKWYMQTGNFEAMKSLQIANAISLILALGSILFFSGFSRCKKWLFSAFLLASPAIWYMDWPSPEVFTYSLVAASVAFFSSKRYALSTLFAALASTQNPPLVFLLLLPLIYGVVGVIRGKKYLRAVPLLAAALPFLAPMIFFYLNFGSTSLIFKTGSASFSEISLSRTASFFFDLNQGMLPYLPGLLIFFTFLLVRGWRRKSIRIYELLVIIVMMAVLAETTVNWNAGSEGIMRYAIWMLPLVIWGIVDGVDLKSRPQLVAMAAILISQLVIVFNFPSWFFNADEIEIQTLDTHMENNALAVYVLRNHPSLYNPEPEIFADRTLHSESPLEDHLPLLYACPDGSVTKILTDRQGLERLHLYADIDPAFIADQQRMHAAQQDPFYISLSGDEIKVIEQDRPLWTFRADFRIDEELPKIAAGRLHLLTLTAKNTGTDTWHSGGDFPILASYHLLDAAGSLLVFDQFRGPIDHRVQPGEEIAIPIYIKAPEEPGVYLLEFDLVQQPVAWFKNKGNKTIVMKIEVS